MTYTEVFGGSAIYPSDVSYIALALTADTELAWPLESSANTNIVARIIDITPSGAGLSVIMPDARQVGVGQTTLFNNLGPATVTIKSATGTTLLSIAAGELYQLYLVDNTTEVGGWRNFRYGASTAQAQASSLAGNGLVAVGATLAQASTVAQYSMNITLGPTDRASTLVWTGGLGTFTLPLAATAGNNWFVNIRNGGSGNLTLDPAGSDQINGGATLVLSPEDSAIIACDGVSYYTIGLGQRAVFAFDYTSINVGGLSGNYTLTGSELNRIAYTFTGVLTGNINIVVPTTVQQYWIDNATTGGSYTLAVKTTTQVTPLVVPRNERGIYYSDGSNVVKADTAAGVATPIAVADGGTGATTDSGARTNLGATSVGSAVFTAASASAARAALGAGATGDPLFTAATAASGRATLGAASSGANTDITSLGGLTTALSVAQGGTGVTTSTGTGSVVLATSPTLVTPALGTPSSATLTNATGLPIVAGTTGTLSIARGGTGATTSTGTGDLVLATSPTLITPALGTPSSATLTNATGLPIVAGTTGTLSVARGGTGQTSYTDGQLLIGNSTGNTLAKATLTAGTGVAITNGAGTITISATGSGGTVISVSGSGGTTGLTLAGGPITGSGTLTLGGTLAVANGGTGVTTSTGTGAVVLSNSPTLVTPALGTPSSATLTNATGLPIVAGTTGTLGVARGGTGTTTSTGAGDLVLATSPTLITPALGTPSSVTLSNATGLPLASGVTGTLAVANGGTGQATYTNGQLLIGNATGGTLTKATLTAGSGITITNGAGSITIASIAGGGSVTSVDGSGGTTGLTLTGGPITGSGTLTLGGTLAVANGGTGVATSTGSGSNVLSTSPTLVTPALGTPSAAVLTNATGLPLTSGVTGTLPVANGGTGQTSYTDGQLLIGNSTGNTLTKATITAGSGITVTNAGGSITIAATAGGGGTVTSVSGSGGTTGLTLTGGPITGSGTLTLGGTLAVASGGTGVATSTGSGSVVLSTSPTLTTPALGTPSSVTLTNATGLPIVAGTTGTLSVARGGTGQTSYTDGQLLIGNSAGNTLDKATLTAGAGITVTNAAGAITIAATSTGTVTSVAISGGTTGLTVTGSPITTSGTFTLGGTLAIANGGTGVATSTGLGSNVLSNSPTLVTPALGTPSSVTLTNGTGLPIVAGTTGTLSVARGGTGVTASTGSGDLVLSASPALTGTPTTGGIEIGYRSVPRSTTTTTAVVADRGKCIAVSAGITIPDAVFSAGDALSIYNDSASAVTITQGGSLVLRQGGTTNTGNRTLAPRGLATIWFNGSSEAVITGAGVS